MALALSVRWMVFRCEVIGVIHGNYRLKTAIIKEANLVNFAHSHAVLAKYRRQRLTKIYRAGRAIYVLVEFLAEPDTKLASLFG